jgi:3'(2'), 5'-bisphosphate nucleotidase
VLDPVDGTAKFMFNQQYAVALALLEHGQQKLGILGCPNLNLETGRVVEEIIDRDGYGYMIYAVTGQGAFIQSMDRDSIAASQEIPKLEEVANLSDLRLVRSTTLSRTSNAEFPVKVASRLSSELTTDLYSAQMHYVALVVGGCNALVRMPLKKNLQFKLWDHVGGMLIAEEAGCKVTDLLGNVIDCTVGSKLGAYGIIVAPEGTHARLLDAVQKLLQEEVEEMG